MSAIATPEELASAADATRAQRDLELALLAAEARLALEAAEPVLGALPGSAVVAIDLLARFVRMVIP